MAPNNVPNTFSAVCLSSSTACNDPSPSSFASSCSSLSSSAPPFPLSSLGPQACDVTDGFAYKRRSSTASAGLPILSRPLGTPVRPHVSARIRLHYSSSVRCSLPPPALAGKEWTGFVVDLSRPKGSLWGDGPSALVLTFPGRRTTLHAASSSLVRDQEVCSSADSCVGGAPMR